MKTKFDDTENEALSIARVSVSVTDLRVGNYLLKSLKSGNGRKINDKIGVQDIVRIYENTGSFNYELILITEEWLLKFGFEKYGMLHDSYKLNPFIVELGILGNNYTFRKIMNKDESILLKEIKYVHELQNIYKELKGYELKDVSLTEH